MSVILTINVIIKSLFIGTFSSHKEFIHNLKATTTKFLQAVLATIEHSRRYTFSRYKLYLLGLMSRKLLLCVRLCWKKIIFDMLNGFVPACAAGKIISKLTYWDLMGHSSII